MNEIKELDLEMKKLKSNFLNHPSLGLVSGGKISFLVLISKEFFLFSNIKCNMYLHFLREHQKAAFESPSKIFLLFYQAKDHSLCFSDATRSPNKERSLWPKQASLLKKLVR